MSASGNISRAVGGLNGVTRFFALVEGLKKIAEAQGSSVCGYSLHKY